MLTATKGMSQRLACKAVGLARSTYRRLPVAQTPADPDAEMRAWLRSYATKHPCHGFRRAWAALRYDERREVNKKKVHRLWREEGLQVRVHSPRKRAGVSSIPPIEADAPNVVWAIDFQFDSTIDGKAIKIASMIDEHTRESLLDLVERSITADRLVAELEAVFAAAGGPAKVLRMDNGPEFISQVLQRFCDGKVGLSYIPPGTWNNGYIESFNNRLRKECLKPQPLEHPARSPRGDRRLQTRAQSSTPPFGAGLPNARRVRCPMRAHPPPGGLRDQLNPKQTNPTLNPGGLSIGDSPDAPDRAHGVQRSHPDLNNPVK
jgi:putative transposase